MGGGGERRVDDLTVKKKGGSTKTDAYGNQRHRRDTRKKTWEKNAVATNKKIHNQRELPTESEEIVNAGETERG